MTTAMTPASRVEQPRSAWSREGQGHYWHRDPGSVHIAAQGAPDQWLSGTQVRRRARRWFDREWLSPGQLPRAALSKSILKWMSTSSNALRGETSEFPTGTIWCDLGEVILFLVDKRSLDAYPESRGEIGVSGSPGQGRPVCVDDEPDPEMESRVFANLWLRDSRTVIVTVEDGGRLAPRPFSALPDEGDENED